MLSGDLPALLAEGPRTSCLFLSVLLQATARKNSRRFCRIAGKRAREMPAALEAAAELPMRPSDDAMFQSCRAAACAGR